MNDEVRLRPVCKSCGKEGLEWAHRAGSWQLFNEVGEPHQCNESMVRDEQLGDFDDL